MIPAAIAKRPIPGGALLTGLLCVVAAVLGFPMDLAMWGTGSARCAISRRILAFAGSWHANGEMLA